ncbi:uncharacterized protein MONOS_8611 [Monocercomonoides exilis]|uniref:uncharacterized protein n=1 Tax=Monocercomonoides exilis TaxID=2049356 RepID=UPI0035599502|nr:hypothetical protein MONOS_8611 [Monocercomonoides exilis]|eukprot:MONOS_8611.1-p1 / transcript=MONOS_8611.1 / gene=MONOS_8611 / organism=Monocercomonoides_exilis_PA203 / gene_product=unspecified product / transcript_product=unspecified product / location=Mono_scaffold00328:59536-60525(-) / protein_length=330 / sequence_SO=supercontig / SO=protein_coding / is_pseudo=false
MCKARYDGGGLRFYNISEPGSGCIYEEDGEGVSSCAFDCSFTSCSLTNNGGGGMFCKTVPATQFKKRSVQFISCSALREGGGFFFRPEKSEKSDDGFYCYFLFFHECKCRDASNPYGHDAYYVDYYNVFLSSKNPLYDCYTTNTDDKRVCFAYNFSNAGDWTYDQTSKKDWLKDKTIYVSVNGNDLNELCGVNESYACRATDVAVIRSMIQVSLSVTLMEGDHQREATTIDIGSKKISVIGKGRMESSIEMKSLSSSAAAGALFGVTTGHLGLLRMKVDCYSEAETSRSVVVVSDGGGSLSLEDVVITTSVSSGNVIHFQCLWCRCHGC